MTQRIHEVTVTRRVWVVAEDAHAACRMVRPPPICPSPDAYETVDAKDVGAFLFRFDGQMWATDGARTVVADVAPGAVRDLRVPPLDAGDTDLFRNRLRAWAVAPAGNLPPDLVVPCGPGPWPSEKEAAFTRRLTELPGAVVDYIEAAPICAWVGRVRINGKVVGYAAPQRVSP